MSKPRLQSTNSNSSDKSELNYLRPSDFNSRNSSIDAAATNEWSSKKYVWIADNVEGFVRGQIRQEGADGFLTVDLPDGKRISIHSNETQRMNPPKFSKVEDMSSLTYLNEASVLFNLKERYDAGLIYTYSGLFCVVINPYRRLPIYTDKIIELYRGKKRETVPPHIFAVASDAYRLMMHNREHQSILCT